MAQGKYSPCYIHDKEYKYNCYGQEPAPWTEEIAKSGVKYDDKTMGPWFDDEGFDSYGYSSFDADGNYAGNGFGVDRLGYTEDEYYLMDENQWQDACDQAAKYKNDCQMKLI